MKEKLCEICNKSYKINYFYTHKSKSKIHQKNLNRNNKNLLKNEDNDNMTRNVKILLNELLEKINNFIINI
jgi:hypothetical protein